MTASAGAWYRVGEVNVIKDSQSVVGVGTNWQNDVISIAIGDAFTVDATTWYEVIAVNSDTSITLDRGFEGGTQNSAKYAIMRGTSGTILTRIAGQVAVQFNQKQLFLDELRTWLNSDNASEELTDSHGLKQSVKTPKQMARDHDEKLAHLEGIHPYPWAFRKGYIESLREQNMKKHRASGFIQLGGDFESEHSNVVAKGLWTKENSPNVLMLGNPRVQNGNPIVHIAGVEIEICDLCVSDGTASAELRFADPEDGTRTYEALDGSSVKHESVEMAFLSETQTNKVVLKRTDLSALELYKRKITSSDSFVYKHGILKSQATAINGVATEPNNQQSSNYFDGEQSRARGVNFLLASESQKRAIAADIKNWISFNDEDGYWYQWTLRDRQIAGIGNGDWQWLDTIGVAGHGNNLSFAYPKSIVNPRCDNEDFNDFGPSATYGYNSKFYANYNRTEKYNSDGVFFNRINESYLLPILTVDRLNTGSYHILNPEGSRMLGDGVGAGNERLWHSSGAVKANRIEDLFISHMDSGAMSIRGGAGELGGTSGRIADGRFSNVIYSGGKGGVCLDMRCLARSLTLADINNQIKSVLSGKYRGVENQVHTLVSKYSNNHNLVGEYTVTDQFAEYQQGFVFKSNSNFDSNLSALTLQSSRFSKVILSGDNGASKMLYKSKNESVAINGWWPLSASGYCYLFNYDSSRGVTVDELNALFPIGTTITLYTVTENPVSTVSAKMTHMDVIADAKQVVQCNILKDGFVGSFTQLEKINTPLKLSRPLAETPVYGMSTHDLGENWTSITLNSYANIGTSEISSALNDSQSKIHIFEYFTQAKYSKIKSNKAEIDSLNTIFVTNSGDAGSGRDLMFSLCSKIGASSNNEPFELAVTLNSKSKITHSPLLLTAPMNKSEAVKTTICSAQENGRATLVFQYSELKYSDMASDWGDDGVIHIAEGAIFAPDDNGNINTVGSDQLSTFLGWN